MGKVQLNHKAALAWIDKLVELNDLLKDSNVDLGKMLSERNREVDDLTRERDYARQSNLEARQLVVEWKERYQNVEKDNAILERERDNTRNSLTISEANVQRLQGWVDAKMNREPRLITKSERMETPH